MKKDLLTQADFDEGIRHIEERLMSFDGRIQQCYNHLDQALTEALAKSKKYLLLTIIGAFTVGCVIEILVLWTVYRK